MTTREDMLKSMPTVDPDKVPQAGDEDKPAHKAKGIALIVIDPGHGGKDPGALAADGKMQEKKINMNVALKLRDKLEAKGFDVEMTHDTDKDMSLTARGKFATSVKADFMIAVHHNSEATKKAKGFDVIYESNAATTAKSFRMAKLIATEFKSLHQTEHRVFTKPGVHDDWFTIMSSTKVPVVITEYAFLSSPEDVKDVDTLTEQWEEAAAICRAVCQYYGVK